jgi:hypothetical protein
MSYAELNVAHSKKLLASPTSIFIFIDVVIRIIHSITFTMSKSFRTDEPSKNENLNQL